jgi:hypothetical protein
MGKQLAFSEIPNPELAEGEGSISERGILGEALADDRTFLGKAS